MYCYTLYTLTQVVNYTKDDTLKWLNTLKIKGDAFDLNVQRAAVCLLGLRKTWAAALANLTSFLISAHVHRHLLWPWCDLV